MTAWFFKEGGNMKRMLAVSLIAGLVLGSSSAFAAEDVVSAVRGTIQKIDASTRSVVVRAADGTEHTVHVGAGAAVHGTKIAAQGTFRGLKEGTDVVVHYTRKGTRETALEVDTVGKDGLKTLEGTTSELDRATKKLVVRTADGTKETFALTRQATADAGKDIASQTEKATKVTVYYTEQAGHKTAHFFEHL
jgi:Cu/Ag efflux protein CusF